MRTHEELHAEAMQHYAMAHHYLGKLKETLDQMTAGRVGSGPITSPVRCVREWTDWLSLNGPALKSDIVEATGIKFTERGTPYTVEWSTSLSEAPDDQFAPNTIMKIGSRAEGRGAPPKVYFLWSQRWDVHPLFGVGPLKPKTVVDYVNEIGEVGFDPEPLTGVVKPPVVSPHALAPGPWEEPPLALDEPVPQAEWAEPEPPTRYATIEEWDEAWAPTFDIFVANGHKPTDEWKQAFRDTLPAGADLNAAIAIAHRQAVERSRQPSEPIAMEGTDD